jgi:hypothetical protein
VDKVTPQLVASQLMPFNSPIEIGLRTLVILTESFPSAYPLQKLVYFDYMIVHSDDLPDGPAGLHPKTPHRGEELLVRRIVVQEGLTLYQSRGLIDRRFEKDGVFYGATERSAMFLDALTSSYTIGLRERAEWLVNTYGSQPQEQLEQLIRRNIGQWGAEFEQESVLWDEGLR